MICNIFLRRERKSCVQSRRSLSLLLLALIAVNVELDIFLPSLPQMRQYFGVEESAIEWVLTINFLGLAVSGLFCGWLSDFFGRKKIIVAGLTLFAVGSFGCILAESFSLFLASRLLQGIGCGAPATVSFAAICDLYPNPKATQIISAFNGIITSATVGAPLLGVLLGGLWGWKANFFFIAILSVLSYL
jgi:DHA1 family bicyclomycin/chloramphenicol resistance-like MFS transporter